MCKLISFAISVEPFGAAKAFTKCETHDWPVEGPVGAEYLCPLGRVEKAVEDGLAKIAAAQSNGHRESEA
jgi:hypothetical protein